MKDIVIIGAGGQAKEVAYLIKEINRLNNEWNILGFIDYEESTPNKKIGRFRIIGTDKWVKEYSQKLNVVFGIGNSSLVKKLVAFYAENANLEFPNIIHPSASGDWDKIKMGHGNVIAQSTVLTTEIRMGSFNLINYSSTIGHDVEIGDFNIINPSVNISGGVKIGNGVMLGVGSQILQYKNICSNSVVGAGAVVVSHIEEEGTYLGVPARKVVC